MLRVDAHGDARAAKLPRHVAHEIQRLRRPRADDHARHARLERAPDGRLAAQAAAEFARNRDRAGDGAHGVEIALLAAEGRIEIDHMQKVATLAFPPLRKGRGVA